MASPVERIRGFHPELRTLRRDIHAHPELAFQESRTSSLVVERLKGWDFEHRSKHQGRMHACSHDGHTAMLLGTARDLAERRVREIAAKVAEAFGATAEVRYMRGYPATVNSPAEAQFAARAAERLFGKDKVLTDFDPVGGRRFTVALGRGFRIGRWRGNSFRSSSCSSACTWPSSTVRGPTRRSCSRASTCAPTSSSPR